MKYEKKTLKLFSNYLGAIVEKIITKPLWLTVNIVMNGFMDHVSTCLNRLVCLYLEK